MGYIFRLLIFFLSIEGTTQLYLHESVTQTDVPKPNLNRLEVETPLNTKVCNHSNINGSVKNTNILMLIPAAAIKSGKLSSCALYESIGDIEGDTLRGMSLKDRNRIDDNVRDDCAEMICRARNADLISERAQEVISLTKKTSKNSNTSATKNLNKIANKYMQFYSSYGSYKGAKFKDTEDFLSDPLENLIVNQFNKLPLEVQNNWLQENKIRINNRIERERREYNRAIAVAKAKAEAKAKAKAEAKAAEAKAEAEAAAARRAHVKSLEAKAAARRQQNIDEMIDSNLPVLILLLLIIYGYIYPEINKFKNVKDLSSLELLVPQTMWYFLFLILVIISKVLYPGLLIGYSQFFWAAWIPLILYTTYKLFIFHYSRYEKKFDELEKKKRIQEERKAKAAAAKAAAEAKAKAKAAAAKAAAEAKAKAAAEAKAKAKKEAELKIKEKEKEISTYQSQIKNSLIKKDELKDLISKVEQEIQALKDSINDEKSRFKKLVKKYPFLSKGKIIKNR